MKTLKDIRPLSYIKSEDFAKGVSSQSSAIRQEAIKWIKSMEKDYSDESERVKFKPQNNREYWLFTEERQRWMDFFNITEKEINKED